MQTSTRFGVSYPSPARTDPADAAIHIGNVVTGLEKALRSDSGLASARPVSSVGTPGIVGRMYYATDDGQMYYDYGTGWITLYNSNSNLIKTTNPSGSNYTYQSFVGAEPYPRYAVTARGQQEWGVGTTPADTNLYRRAADQLATDDLFVVRDRMEVFNWTGEANPNIRVLGNASDQRIEFGPGGGVSTDINLYRAAASLLQTDGSFRVSKSLVVDQASAGWKLFFGGAQDTNLYRQQAGVLRTDGSFRVGSYLDVDLGGAGASLRFGSASDTSIYRFAANYLRSPGSFEAGNLVAGRIGGGTPPLYGVVFSPHTYSSTNRILTAVRVDGDTQPNFYIDGDGRSRWGPGGSSGEDVTLGRARIGVLSTPGMLALGGTSGGGDIAHALVFDHATSSPGVIDNGGGILFVQSGVLKFRGGGNILNVAMA